MTVKRCNTLNPASLIPLPTDEEAHDCKAELDAICSLRPDITDIPPSNADFVLYTDALVFWDNNGANRVGYAIVTDSEVLCSAYLPCHLLAQGAELIAFTEACKIAGGKSVTIYTHSCYVFRDVHDFGALLKCRNFLKSDGKPVLNYVFTADLLQAILLPSAIAVCKCSAHNNLRGPISQGNARADVSARIAARQPVAAAGPLMTSSLEGSDASLTGMQSLANSQD